MNLRKENVIAILLLSIMSLTLAQKTVTKRPIRLRHSTLRTTVRRNSFTPRPFSRAPLVLPKIKSSDSVVGFNCIRSRGPQPDTQNPKMYKICVPAGKNWIVYSYRCPSGTVFNKNISRCAPGSLSTTVTSIIHGTTSNPLPLITEEIISLSSSTITSSKNTTDSGTSNVVGIVTTGITSTDPNTESSSSSSEEIYLTHPPHFTNSLPHKIHESVFHTTLTNLYANKFNQPHSTLSSFPHKEKFHTSHSTAKPEVNDSNKLTTWQSLANVSKTTSAPSSYRSTNATPMNFMNPLHISDQNLIENFIEENRLVSNTPAVRWKASTVPPHRERFPGLRPNNNN